ncbi:MULTISPECIES: acyltransferase family protein [unclassified Arenibacter]|uniref:acyltransferase family protein n=1 Tax=unclassified Arenibacter TaxID=2615047 RepID=UPI0015F2A7D3|nr:MULTISPECIES: heparan-alpha-glucosaminide N-acetyltransferase domain-containing protein [unclassified Arenibacter]
MNSRLNSLDFFRGATVIAMIIANDPGSSKFRYQQLSHAAWEGCTVTDLIFPLFLFIVGISISLSFNKAITKGKTKKDLLLKSFKRGTIIFILGVLLNLFPGFDFTSLRIPGVLQRIALVYVFCSVIYLYVGPKSQYIWFISLLIGYYIIMSFVPVPGIGPPNLDPTNNFSAWFDRLILNGNIGPMGRGLYDSTGIFTTIPAIASGLSGIFIGRLLNSNKMHNEVKLIWMFIIGCTLLIIGWIWSFDFPMIKRLWTSSYVLHTSGVAILFFTTSYWFIDVLKLKKGIKPVLAFGSNALAAYFLASVFGKCTSAKILNDNNSFYSIKDWIYINILTKIFNPYNASFAYSILSLSIIFILVWWLYKRNIIIKV